MKTRANRLAADGDSAGAETYRLDEPADSSDYRSVQNYTDNVINVCRESTYRFMKLVIDELDAMHREAGSPLTKLHVGGDEVPHGAWEKSPLCRQTMDELGIENPRLLQDYFFDRVYDILEEKDIVMGGWEEVAFTDQDGVPTVKPATDDAIIPYVWSNIWGGGTEDRAYKLANAGYPVVMSHASNFYFDMAYNKHWQEPGFYWAAMLTTEEPFSFMPFNLFESAATTSYGNELADDYFEDKVRLNESARENILGLQGQLWTETVNVPGRMNYMIYPRLLGLAERAWTGEPDWSNARTDTIQERDRVSAWNTFANRLGQVELPRLDRRYPSLDYRIPAPGAVIQNNMLYANISFPGLTIRYELDGSEPTRESPIYSEPVEISPNDQPRISGFSSTGRAGRSVSPTR
jgi:hexosaminidase